MGITSTILGMLSSAVSFGDAGCVRRLFELLKSGKIADAFREDFTGTLACVLSALGTVISAIAGKIHVPHPSGGRISRSVLLVIGKRIFEMLMEQVIDWLDSQDMDAEPENDTFPVWGETKETTQSEELNVLGAAFADMQKELDISS